MKPTRPNLKPFLLLLLLPFVIAGIMLAIEDIRTTIAIFENSPENVALFKIYGVAISALFIGYVVGWAVGYGKGYKSGKNYRSG